MSGAPDDFRAALADRYPIGQEIGRGSMGTVYRAHDLRHNRAVAIKVLHAGVVSPDQLRRFHREIEIAARLNHPHIVPIYDSGVAAGVPYCVMPCIEGESLRQRLRREPQLPVAEAVDIARQAADALHYAHDSGVIHRDVKPENLLLTRSHVLVVDFGIATAVGSDDGLRTTSSRVIVGTPMYMSPEQASGAATLDARCDVYALGCVLYEMLAGQPPFTGPTVESVLRQHLALGAPPVRALRPATPRQIAKAVSRALAKSPADRFATAEVLLGALTDRGDDAEGPGSDKVMLVVLPLDNLSGQPDQDYFADGLTEELITQIARLSPGDLGVIARTTAWRYKHTQKSIAEIGAELGVQFVLGGSARVAGSRVRVSVQLIKVEDQTHLWADTYDRDLADVFAVQDDVGRKVAEALQVRLLEAARPTSDRERTENPEAYDTYLRGQHFARSAFITKDPADHERARELFHRASAADARFTPPLAALARLSFEHYRDYGDAASLSVAEDVARGLLQRNPNSAAARGTLASVYLWSGRKELAMREARIALELNPAEVAAHEALGVAFNISGLLPEAIDQFTTWRALDPLAPAPCRRLVDGYIWTGNFELARALLADASALYPRSPVFRRHMARIWYETGDFDRATDLLKQALALEPYRGFEAQGQLALIHARTGRHEAGLALLTPDVLEYAKRDVPESILYPAQFYALTGNVRAALEWLETAVKAGNENYAWFSRNPDFDNIRATSGFASLLNRAETAQQRLRAQYAAPR